MEKIKEVLEKQMALLAEISAYAVVKDLCCLSQEIWRGAEVYKSLLALESFNNRENR